MAEPTRHLTVNIEVEVHQPGINPRWHHEHEVPIPPDYPDDQDHLENFVLHEVDKAVHDWSLGHHGRSRAQDIIAQFDLRSRAIENIIKHAPHDLSRKGLAAAILAVIHMDNDTLFATYEHVDLGHR